MSRRRRAFALLGLALVLGALAAADVGGRERALRRALAPEVPVVVARRAIPAGTRIAASTVGVRSVPARYAPQAAFSAAAEVVGERAAVDIPGGADLGPADVQAPNAGPPSDAWGLERGQRVASLVAVGEPAEVGAGVRVDVIVTRDGGASAGSTRLALQDAEVLASRALAPAQDGDGQARVAVQLRVTVRQAVYLAAAQSFAREIRVLPRASGDRGTVAPGVEVDGDL